MQEERSSTRRDFLAATGTTLAATTMAERAAGGEPQNLPAPPPDSPKALKPTGGDLGSLYSDVMRLATQKPFELSFLNETAKSLEEYKAAGRKRMWADFGYQPAKVEFNVETLDRADMGTYVREKILFSTTGQFRVPAYVLIPKNLKRPAPAIVDLHSHGGNFIFGKEKVIDFGEGRNHPAMVRYHGQNYDGRPTSTHLVQRGYVVMTTDAFYFGERRMILDADLKYGWDRAKYSQEDVDYLRRRCGAKESTLAKSLALAGIAWPGIVAWDDMRTVDYLVGREEVDAKRIGCLGISMGGYRTILLSGLDERIKAASIVGFMSTVNDMVHNKIDTHSWVHFPPGIHGALDLPDVAGMMAPKPLMVQQCRQDGLFTPAGMKHSVKKLTAIYEKARAKEKFHGRFYDVPHRYTIPMQDDAVAFFDRYLKA